MCATLAETVSLLQESIYTEAANIFGHLQPRQKRLESVVGSFKGPEMNSV